MDYHIRATDEADLWKTLIDNKIVIPTEETWLNSEGTANTVVVNKPAKGIDLDVIGLIYNPTENMIVWKDPQGNELSAPEMAPVPGFHANIRGGLSDEQVTGLGDKLIPAPATPRRTWA